MNIKIPAPHGSSSISFILSDIIRIESRSLSFFESCAYNLYIVFSKHQGEELFSLFCYKEEGDMIVAYDTISGLLKGNSAEPITLEMEPMKA